MNIELKFLNVFNGDSIILRFLGNDLQYHNILIDGGFVGTYNKILKPELQKVLFNKEKIDLLILSHYDLDHIGGILSFIQDKSFDKSHFVDQWWLNHDIKLPHDNGEISVSQLSSLLKYLNTIGKLPENPIISGSLPLNMYGAKITVLSPDKSNYEKASTIISEIVSEKIGISYNDYHMKIEEFSDNFTVYEDSSISNGSSIGILFENAELKILLLADSFPSTIAQSLTKLGYSSENRLKVDYVKVSHHGSKHNTSFELLNLIDCNNFIICANGENKYMLPHKETLAKILFSRNSITAEITKFYFNQKNERLLSIFSVDGEFVYSNHNFNSIFPVNNTDCLTLIH